MDAPRVHPTRGSRRRRRAALALLALLLGGALLAPSFAPERGAVERGRSAVAPPVTIWADDFSSGDFRRWSWWGQGQSELWGHIAVVDPIADRIPRLAERMRRVARMAVTAEDAAHRRYHAKLYRRFAERDPEGVERSPTDVSGTYSAWFYVPRSYRLSGRTWSNVLQFKEEHGSRSDPLWWVQLGSARWARKLGDKARWRGDRDAARATRPVAFLNHWDNRWRHRIGVMPVPLGRWFAIRAVIRPDQRRMDVFVDGRRLDTARASRHPVAPFRASSRAWVFGVGNYSTAPSTKLYVGAARYTRP